MKSYLDPLKCAHCSKHIQEFVKPEVPRSPKLILVGEAPGVEEYHKGQPFVGPSGKVLRGILPVDAIIVNACNTYSKDKPTTEIINIERESHLLPLLAEYPGVPVVSLGAFAAQALMGGKRSDSSMAGEVIWLHDRPVLFTYHPAFYLRSGSDPRILAHIEAYIKSALSAPLKIRIHIDEIPPKDKEAFVLDIESTGADLPYYGTKVVLLGIMPERLGEAYQFTAQWLAKPTHIRALQKWIDSQSQVIGHHLLSDILWSESVNLNFDALNWYDTEIAIKDRGHDLYGGFGLKSLAHHHWFAPPWEAKFHAFLREMKADKTKKLSLFDMPMKDLSPYNAGDLYYTKRLAEARSAHGAKVFVQLDNDYNKYIKQMSVNGLYLSQSKLKGLLREYRKERDKMMARGRKQAHLGKDFNFGSWQQVLPLVRQLSGNADLPNTREQTLMTVFDKHPFIETLLDIRGAEKTVEMLEEIEARRGKDGIVHATITEHGAETSRTTSKNPNIQNWAEKIRSMLVSRYKK